MQWLIKVAAKFSLKKLILMGLLVWLVAYLAKGGRQIVEYQADDVITLGVAWPAERGLFVEGAELAVKHINKQGGVLGKQVELIIDEREEALYQALEKTSMLTAGDSIREYSRIVARSFSYHPKQVVAVTGHQFSATAFSAAQIYQQNQRVFIAPTATEVLLTNMNFDYVYRMLPNNVELGMQLAKYAADQSYNRVAVFNERTDTALELSEAFSQAAEENSGITTAIQRSFFTDMPKREFVDYAVKFSRQHKKTPLDAIFLFTNTQLAIQIIQEFQKRGLGQINYIGGENLDTQAFWSALDDLQQQTNATINVTIPTVFDPQSELNQEFIDSFSQQYQQAPDRLAALGYDSIYVIIRAIASAGSAEPSNIVDEIRYARACRGLTGNIQFQDNGDVSNKTYIYKSRHGNDYRYRTYDGQAIDQSIDRQEVDMPGGNALQLCSDLNQGIPVTTSMLQKQEQKQELQ